MSAPSSPTWMAATRRRTSYADMRISDAERTEVADLLSRHYGDGRLDQAEFDQRLEQAMKAKTYRDLSGLFADLPNADAPGAPEAHRAATRPRRFPAHRILFLILIIVLTAAAWHALTWMVTPWVWIALLGVIALYATRNSRSS